MLSRSLEFIHGNYPVTTKTILIFYLFQLFEE